jgi:hypothetical protein
LFDSGELETMMQSLDLSITTRVIDRQALLALGSEWEELVTVALEENPFYSRQYLEAYLTHMEPKAIVKALVIYRDSRLIALLPFVTDRWRWLGVTKVNKALWTSYLALTAPLIDQRDADVAVNALITAMGDGSTGSKTWLLPDFNLDGPVNKLFADVLETSGQPPVTPFEVYDRPVLDQHGTFNEHMKTHVSKNRRKSLMRCRKRLAELGNISEAVYTGGAELDKAVDEFLRVEKSGWKGKRGTAFDNSAAARAFAKQAFGSHNGESNDQSLTRADLLLLDDKVIAVSLSLQTGRTGFTFKTTFDEDYKKQGVGMLLEENIIRNFLEGDWADRLDSSTEADHVLLSMWNGADSFGDILLHADRFSSGFKLKVFLTLETTRRTARKKAKELVNKMRTQKND